MLRITFKHKIFFVLVGVFIHFQLVGQLYTDTPWYVSFNRIDGDFQVHTEKLQYFNGVNPYGFDIDVGKWLLASQIKERYGIYSKWGMQISYANFNHKDLGYTVNSVMFIEPLIKARGKLRVSLKTGAGVGYVSNPYHKTDNPFNKAYSTKFVFPMQGSLNAYYFINKQFAIRASGSFRHVSNGGVKQPNLGVNYIAYGLGVEYILQKYNVNPVNTIKANKEKEKRTVILLGYSQKRDTLAIGAVHIFNIILNRSFQISRNTAIVLGGLVEYQHIQDAEVINERLGIGPVIGNEFFIGDIRFGQQLGIYILKRNDAPTLLFQNYYLRYLLKQNWVIGADLKVHGIDADYLLFQLGYVF
ncbi:acyloxyacyl hydrolase [Plebeiibacterium sediminum]|uniref:Acyloxyacyl hydrolase n=1 Tax=Plebeiibacterium sediminum TaxID=2992112 RepID=A0AAE3M3E0_9BACT|nr:acyloxyacyl hydrolase [Plebeiobacterium sediminum]MCW3786114.1 acyloxyacyl hydrolase [Plebeiobacterium sediminum]